MMRVLRTADALTLRTSPSAECVDNCAWCFQDRKLCDTTPSSRSAAGCNAAFDTIHACKAAAPNLPARRPAGLLARSLPHECSLSVFDDSSANHAEDADAPQKRQYEALRQLGSTLARTTIGTSAAQSGKAPELDEQRRGLATGMTYGYVTNHILAQIQTCGCIPVLSTRLFWCFSLANGVSSA